MAREQRMDVARGIAVLFIIACHAAIVAPTSLIATVLREFGGTDIFFVVSGYLAAASAGHYQSAAKYYFGKLLRILPLYYVAVFVFGVMLPPILGPLLPDVKWLPEPAWHLAALSNFRYFLLGKFPDEPLSSDWFIASLLQMQLLFALCAFRSPLRPLQVGVGLAIVARIVLAIGGASQHQLYVFPLARLDAFCLGALFYFGQLPKVNSVLCAVWLTVSLLARQYFGSTFGVWSAVVDYTAVALLVVGLLQQDFRLPFVRFFCWCGTHSLAVLVSNVGVIYLLYVLFRDMLAVFPGELSYLLFLPVAAGLSLAVAVPITKLDGHLQQKLRRLTLARLGRSQTEAVVSLRE